MPNTPYIISGVIYDTSGTAFTGEPTVVLENMTTHETTTASVDSNGAYQIEGANLTSGIAANDWISISVISDRNMHGEIIAKVSAANLVTGFWDTANIYMRNGNKIIGVGSSYPVYHISASHYGETAYALWFLDRCNATNIPFRVVQVMNVAGNSDNAAPLNPHRPLKFDGGIRVIITQTAPTNNPNSMTAGVANAIGDTVKEHTHVTIIVG
ncbi:MAG: hypothetical protein ABIH42_05305 [Planctomycetota bacterium]